MSNPKIQNQQKIRTRSVKKAKLQKGYTGRILQTARVSEYKEQKKLKIAKERRQLATSLGTSAKKALKNADTTGNAAPIIQSAETAGKVFKVARLGVIAHHNRQVKIAVRRVIIKKIDRSVLTKNQYKLIKKELTRRANFVPFIGVVNAVHNTAYAGKLTVRLAKKSVKNIKAVSLITIKSTQKIVQISRQILSGKINLKAKFSAGGKRVKVASLSRLKAIKTSVYAMPKNVLKAIKNAPKNIALGVKNAGKLIAKNAPKAAEKTLRTLKTAVVVGGKATIKTAVKTPGMTFSFAANSLASAQDPTVKIVGQTLKTSQTAAKIGALGTKATVKTGVAGAKHVANFAKSTGEIVKTFRQGGFKSGMKKLGGKVAKGSLNVAKATAKAVYETFQKAALRYIMPAILVVVIAVSAMSGAVGGVAAVVGFVDESVGWIFKIFHKREVTDEDYENFDDLDEDEEMRENYLEIIAQTRAILDNVDNKNSKIAKMETVYPTTILDGSNRIGTDWREFYTALNSKNSEILTAENTINSAVLPTAPTGEENAWDETKITYSEAFDWSKIANDFAIEDYISFLIMLHFEKFPDDDTDTSGVKTEFSEDDIKSNLYNSSGYSGYSEGLPALYDYVQFSVSYVQNSRRVEEERTGEHEIEEEVFNYRDEPVYNYGDIENPAYTAAYENYQSALTAYNNAKGTPAEYGTQMALKSAEDKYNNFSPKKIEVRVPPYTTQVRVAPFTKKKTVTETYNVWVEYFSYEIKISVTPRLAKTVLNPRNMTATYPPSLQSTQELYDRYDFAKEFLDEIINGG